MNELIEVIRTLEPYRLVIFSFLFGVGVMFYMTFYKKFSQTVFGSSISSEGESTFTSSNEKDCNSKFDAELAKVLFILDSLKQSIENNKSSDNLQTNLIIEKIEFIKHSVLEIKNVVLKNNEILDKLERRSRDESWR